VRWRILVSLRPHSSQPVREYGIDRSPGDALDSVAPDADVIQHVVRQGGKFAARASRAVPSQNR
jgi:hypothetical protein